MSVGTTPASSQPDGSSGYPAGALWAKIWWVPKWGYPTTDGLYGKIPLKCMIWGYPLFQETSISRWSPAPITLRPSQVDIERRLTTIVYMPHHGSILFWDRVYDCASVVGGSGLTGEAQCEVAGHGIAVARGCLNSWMCILATVTGVLTWFK